ncbi:hypothetical protein AMTR_s00080p00051910 [Amborella trichopoda]|uniref:Uncharacterized protein n=1 Tax=Amborella trichopoda TaxID=13333 RepID=W1PCX4_AMBTC|nr:hypothetical protein AMTR_s00080p00051910 [Amborella trichopoda]
MGLRGFWDQLRDLEEKSFSSNGDSFTNTGGKREEEANTRPQERFSGVAA